MPFAVLTSKKAQQDFLNIKARHADILTDMTVQKARIDAFNQQQAAEKQNQQIMQNEMQKEQMAQNGMAQKNTLDFQLKEKELNMRPIS